MDELLKPFQLAGRGVEGDEGVAVEVPALAIGAVEVGGRRSRRREHQAAREVDGHVRPRVRARAVLPALAFPRLDAGLARSRNRVKRPQQLPAARIPAPNVAVEAGARRAFAVAASGDDDVAEDDRRRIEHEEPVHVAADTLFQVEVTALAEAGHDGAGLRIERDHPPVSGLPSTVEPVTPRPPASRRRHAC